MRLKRTPGTSWRSMISRKALSCGCYLLRIGTGAPKTCFRRRILVDVCSCLRILDFTRGPTLLLLILRFDNVLDWSLEGVAKGKPTYAFCVAHNGCCRLGNTSQPTCTTTVEAAGPTCEPFSYAGKRKKARNLKATHEQPTCATRPGRWMTTATRRI